MKSESTFKGDRGEMVRETEGQQESVSSKETKGKKPVECVVMETKEYRLNTFPYSSASPERMLGSEF